MPTAGLERRKACLAATIPCRCRMVLLTRCKQDNKQGPQCPGNGLPSQQGRSQKRGPARAPRCCGGPLRQRLAEAQVRNLAPLPDLQLAVRALNSLGDDEDVALLDVFVGQPKEVKVRDALSRIRACQQRAVHRQPPGNAGDPQGFQVDNLITSCLNMTCRRASATHSGGLATLHSAAMAAEEAPPGHACRRRAERVQGGAHLAHIRRERLPRASSSTMDRRGTPFTRQVVSATTRTTRGWVQRSVWSASNRRRSSPLSFSACACRAAAAVRHQRMSLHLLMWHMRRNMRLRGGERGRRVSVDGARRMQCSSSLWVRTSMQPGKADGAKGHD